MLDKNEQARLKKEKEKQDFIRRERINELLLIHPESRKASEETELTELLVDFPCFQAVAEDNFDMLIQLTREIYMECLLPDTIILNQDDEPDNCYVIMQGECKVFVTFKYKKFNKIKTKTKHMCDVGNRACFGELSLLFNGRRTATVQTMEACYVIIIPKQTFNKYMKEPMLKKLNITIQFLKSLNFFDELDPNVLLILASKTNLSVLQSNSLIIRQDKKSKYIYFISKGRVRILRNLPMLIVNEDINETNYTKLFRDPDEKQLKDPSQVRYMLLALTELGLYECFGEDYKSVSNFMLNPGELSKKEVPYTAISSMQVECYCIKKKDFYEYIDDKTRKQFMIYMRRYPRDYELRSAYYEQHTWSQFKKGYIEKHVKIPSIIFNDSRRMQEIELEVARQEKKRNQVILPKINKKEQNTQRIMSYQKVKKIDFKSVRQLGVNQNEASGQDAGEVEGDANVEGGADGQGGAEVQQVGKAAEVNGDGAAKDNAFMDGLTPLQEFTLLANSQLGSQEAVRMIDVVDKENKGSSRRNLSENEQLLQRSSISNLTRDQMLKKLMKDVDAWGQGRMSPSRPTIHRNSSLAKTLENKRNAGNSSLKDHKASTSPKASQLLSSNQTSSTKKGHSQIATSLPPQHKAQKQNSSSALRMPTLNGDENNLKFQRQILNNSQTLIQSIQDNIGKIKTKNAEDYEGLVMDRVNKEKVKLYSQIQAKNFKSQRGRVMSLNDTLEGRSLQQPDGDWVGQHDMGSQNIGGLKAVSLDPLTEKLMGYSAYKNSQSRMNLLNQMQSQPASGISIKDQKQEKSPPSGPRYSSLDTKRMEYKDLQLQKAPYQKAAASSARKGDKRFNSIEPAILRNKMPDLKRPQHQDSSMMYSQSYWSSRLKTSSEIPSMTERRQPQSQRNELLSVNFQVSIFENQRQEHERTMSRITEPTSQVPVMHQYTTNNPTSTRPKPTATRAQSCLTTKGPLHHHSTQPSRLLSINADSITHRVPKINQYRQQSHYAQQLQIPLKIIQAKR